MLRTALGILGATVGALLVLGAVEGIGHVFWPAPELMDPSDPAAMAEHIQSLPVAALLWVALAWMVGTAAGSAVAMWWCAHPYPGVAFITALMMAGGVMTLIQIPHPTWFVAISVVGFPVGSLVGMRVGAGWRGKDSTSTTNQH